VITRNEYNDYKSKSQGKIREMDTPNDFDEEEEKDKLNISDN
jgi:hypothetical protein